MRPLTAGPMVAVVGGPFGGGWVAGDRPLGIGAVLGFDPLEVGDLTAGPAPWFNPSSEERSGMVLYRLTAAPRNAPQGADPLYLVLE